jgi:MazG family protein
MPHNRLATAILSLVNLAARLRAPDGCPWDAEQTYATIKMYLLEEAFEVVEAVEQDSPGAICEELGDVLFQIVFMAQLACEKGAFDFADVVEKITEKMIRRHPHVFSKAKVNNAEEVAVNWSKIKDGEKQQTSGRDGSLLDSLPKNLPALLIAHRVSERVSKVGFDWADKEEVWDKVEEESRELEAALRNGDAEKIFEELGDLLFSLVNLSRHCGFNTEDVLRSTVLKFIDRFGKMERELHLSGKTLEEASLEQMDRAWEEAK